MCDKKRSVFASGSKSGLCRSSNTEFTIRTFINRPSARVPRYVTSPFKYHLPAFNDTLVCGVKVEVLSGTWLHTMAVFVVHNTIAPSPRTRGAVTSTV